MALDRSILGNWSRAHHTVAVVNNSGPAGFKGKCDRCVDAVISRLPPSLAKQRLAPAPAVDKKKKNP